MTEAQLGEMMRAHALKGGHVARMPEGVAKSGVPEDKEKILRKRRKVVRGLYAQGKTHGQIAKSIKVSKWTVSNDIKCLRMAGEI